MYLTYDEYSDMGGTLDETTYESIEFEAEEYVNWCTFNRLINETTISTVVKKCIYELTQYIYAKRAVMLPTEEDVDKSIYSMENDGVRVTYNKMTASELYTENKIEIYSIIRRYLFDLKNTAGKKILYRGLYSDE